MGGIWPFAANGQPVIFWRLLRSKCPDSLASLRAPPEIGGVNKAFVLGAGFGTRLMPLTEVLPKPLVPVANKPLITYAFDLLMAGGVGEFVVNTHHLAGAYQAVFPNAEYAGAPIQFVHEEPEILDTGGGLANAAQFLREGDFIVFNGDILTDLPLQSAIEAHRRGDNLATLILRSGGPNRNAAFDAQTGKMRDLRNALNTDSRDLFQFTGIYLARPEFLDLLEPRPQSVIPAMLEAIRDGARMGGVVIDEGAWWDLGDRAAYLEANFVTLTDADFPAFPRQVVPERIHPTARVGHSAEIDANSTVGAGCEIGEGAVLRHTIVWPGAQVAAGADLDSCILTGRENPVSGPHEREDL